MSAAPANQKRDAMFGANGDTAKPAARYADDHYENPQRTRVSHNYTYALYTMREYSEFAPYGRYRKDGCVVRVETDGSGGLIEFVESVESRCYGVPRAHLYVEERPENPEQDHTSSDRVRRRKARLHRIYRYVSRCPNGVTKWDVAARFGVSSATAWHDLALLRSEGKLTSVHKSNGFHGNTNAVWRAA